MIPLACGFSAWSASPGGPHGWLQSGGSKALFFESRCLRSRHVYEVAGQSVPGLRGGKNVPSTLEEGEDPRRPASRVRG